MEDKIVYSIILADSKTPVIRHIAKFETLVQAQVIKNSKKIGSNQRLWIGKYVNGILKESFN